MILASKTEQLALNEFLSLAKDVVGAGSLSKPEAEKRIRDHEKRMATVRAALKKAGVNVEKAERVARQHGEKLAAGVRGLNEATADFAGASPSFRELVKEAHVGFLATFSSMYDDLSDDKDVEAGLILFMVVLAANTMASVVAIGLLGPMAGMAFTGIVVAPFVEETARRHAITSGSGLATFTVAVNTFEFVQYTAMMVSAGVSVVTAVVIRGTVAFMHHMLGSLQKWGYVRDIQDGRKPEDAGSVEYALAIMIHALNNAFGSVFWKLVFPAAFGESVVDEEVFII